MRPEDSRESLALLSFWSEIDHDTEIQVTKYKLEYVWLDGYEPTPNLRSKTKVKAFEAFPSLEEIPVWGFDGSSTRQAEGSDSDCLLQPVAIFPDPVRRNGALVDGEVRLPDGSPHPSNSRATIPDDPETCFGFEQSISSTATAGRSGSRTRGSRCRRASTTRASA